MKIAKLCLVIFATVVFMGCDKDDDDDTPTMISIGDEYAGGIVFYLDGDVDSVEVSKAHGLVAAPEDQSTMGTFGEHWHDAVNLCNNLSAGGYNDWFLPNKTQLKTMYDNLYAGGSYSYGFQSARYWSSTEFEANSAYQIHFNIVYEGQEHTVDKSIGWGAVRAIRNF